MGAPVGGPPAAAQARGGAGDDDRQWPEGGEVVSVAGLYAAGAYAVACRPERPALRMVALDRRRPCWHCSRSLGMATAGPRRGKWVGAVVVDGGYERVVHVACAREMEDG